MLCHKCGEDVNQCFFNKLSTICDDCVETFDLLRHKDAPKDTIPKAIVIKLISGKFGVTCPQCLHRVHRGANYYSKESSTERCPKCGEQYRVRLKEVK